MLRMDYVLFNAKIIRGFTSNVLAICSATSYPFGFSSRIKRLPLNILKCIATTLRNQDKKVEFIQFDQNGSLARSSEFMNTYHNMNIIFQNIGGYASLFNSKI